MATPSGTVQQSSLPNGRPRIEERVWILENRFDEDGVIKPGQLPLSSAVDSTREDVAATSLAVKKTYDEATKKGTLKQAGNVQLCNEFIEDDTKAATPSLAKKANDLAQDALDKANEATNKAEEAIDTAEQAGGLPAADVALHLSPTKVEWEGSTGHLVPGHPWVEEDTSVHAASPERWKFKKGYKYWCIAWDWDAGAPVYNEPPSLSVTNRIINGGAAAIGCAICIRLRI